MRSRRRDVRGRNRCGIQGALRSAHRRPITQSPCQSPKTPSKKKHNLINKRMLDGIERARSGREGMLYARVEPQDIAETRNFFRVRQAVESLRSRSNRNLIFKVDRDTRSRRSFPPPPKRERSRSTGATSVSPGRTPPRSPDQSERAAPGNRPRDRRDEHIMIGESSYVRFVVKKITERYSAGITALGVMRRSYKDASRMPAPSGRERQDIT